MWHSTRVLMCVVLGSAAAFLSTLVAPTTKASAQEEDQTVRMVVLRAPGDTVKSALKSSEYIETKGQRWFVQQIKKRGFKAGGIMKRPDDLMWVMKGGNIDYIVYFASSSGGEFEARIVERDTGKPTKTFAVPKTGDGISSQAAKQLVTKLEVELGLKSAPAPDEDDEAGKADKKAKKTKDEDKKQKEKQKQKAQKPKKDEKQDQKDESIADTVAPDKEAEKEAPLQVGPAYFFSLGGRFFRRSLFVSDPREGAFSFQSNFYPGARLAIKAYPFSPKSSPTLGRLGFYLDVSQGFKSYVFKVNGEDNSVSISHTEAELGLAARFKHGEGGPRSAGFTLLAGARYNSLSADKNKFLPTTTETSVVIGGEYTHPLMDGDLQLTGASKFVPIAFHSSGVDTFGESASSFGFHGEMGLKYGFTRAMSAEAGYNFRILRTEYSGEGQNNFKEADGTDFVHGPFLMLTYRLDAG